MKIIFQGLSVVIWYYCLDSHLEEGRVKEEASAIFHLREVQESNGMVEPFTIKTILEGVLYESPGNGLFYLDESWDSEVSWSPLMIGPPSLQR